MKYIRFAIDGENKFGILDDEKIVELKENFLVNTNNKTGKEHDVNKVRLLSPVNPGKVVLIGLNYVKHAEEVNKPLPKEPMMFMVSPSAIIAHDEKIKIAFSEHTTHFEAELAIVVGKEAKEVKKEEALDYIFGYTIGNDISDRNLQKKDIQYTRAKSFHTYKPLGPVIKTGINPNNLNIALSLNGEVRQDSNTNDLIFNIEEIIESVTKVMTLNPGDVVMTGTPHGVDSIKSGDRIEITIEEIGKLTNEVG